jgi:FtsP/CotA-like multicopper oxidase with cupredoxin domain
VLAPASERRSAGPAQRIERPPRSAHAGSAAAGRKAFTQIGTDGGLLEPPRQHDALEMAPAQRFDVVVDFARYPPGTTVRVVNTASFTTV